MWMWSKRSLSDQENGKIIMLLLVIKSEWENSVIFYIYLHIINIGILHLLLQEFLQTDVIVP